MDAQLVDEELSMGRVLVEHRGFRLKKHGLVYERVRVHLPSGQHRLERPDRRQARWRIRVADDKADHLDPAPLVPSQRSVVGGPDALDDLP